MLHSEVSCFLSEWQWVPVLIYSLCKGGEIDVKGENHKGAVNLLVKS